MGVTSKRLRTVAPYGGIAAAWFVLQTLISEPTPTGVIALGVVFGCLNAMLAIGLVLVYRANRIVNFAHGELGGVAVVLVIELIQFGWPFVPAAVVGVMSAIAIGSLVEATVISAFWSVITTNCHGGHHRSGPGSRVCCAVDPRPLRWSDTVRAVVDTSV